LIVNFLVIYRLIAWSVVNPKCSDIVLGY